MAFSSNTSSIILNNQQYRTIIKHVSVLSEVLRSTDLHVPSDKIENLESRIVDRLVRYMKHKQHGCLDYIENDNDALKYVIKGFIDKPLRRVALERCANEFPASETSDRIDTDIEEEDPEDPVRAIKDLISIRHCVLAIIQVSDEDIWNRLIKKKRFNDEYNVIADKEDEERKCDFVLFFQTKNISSKINYEKVREWMLYDLSTEDNKIIALKNKRGNRIRGWELPFNPVVSLSVRKDISVDNILAMLRQSIADEKATCVDSRNDTYEIPCNYLPGLYKSNLLFTYTASE